MKNILRKEVIIAFIIGIIIASGIVYAATSAREVTYTTNKNGEVQTVADALNDLYSKSSNKIVDMLWKRSIFYYTYKIDKYRRL